ncbi:ABC transporter ATP-binding protein [Nitrosospira sp. Nsp1]|uniref:ABC transporter ATP-binding protein n=1 Tax=Nitrosospira sp. Nsp1 TaxID=136547 RepID=UPI00088D3267|nr:ABC transporter ATP-binding protein [Nitrosospira sp. Nsp1]SCX47891.1 lipopolysaccharide transport system ATP-binding protein [Nitrosospira sp. Nsp1]
MMNSSDIAIRIQNLSKCYQIYSSPHDRLKQFVAPRMQFLLGKPIKRYFREFWALKDISFEINKGETVGIVGCNGSGKSTLLQIICGTLAPTGGTVETRGRIAALLELGSGFNPEFTGRENVYMNAAVLGLSKKQVDDRFDDIAAFADIGQFIEQPVKTYSSGMYIRLAFAVAVNLDPEILIVDEALAVGDELFQRKCYSKIEAIKNKGATVLFVSHSGATIVELCNRAVLIDGGEKLAIGTPKQIVGLYHKMLFAPHDKRSVIRDHIRGTPTIDLLSITSKSDMHSDVSDVAKQENADLQENYDPYLKPKSTIEYESRGAYIESPQILTLSGKRVNNLVCGRIYRYVYTVRFECNASNVRFGMLIKTISGVELGGAISAGNLSDSIQIVSNGSRVQVEFQFKCILNNGIYFLNAGVSALHNDSEVHLHRLLDIEMFRVLPNDETMAIGNVDFECSPNVIFI